MMVAALYPVNWMSSNLKLRAGPIVNLQSLCWIDHCATLGPADWWPAGSTRHAARKPPFANLISDAVSDYRYRACGGGCDLCVGCVVLAAG